jgi:Na+-translocating ferredoxin:NAD+ oxidoreductase RNF subunit RnfB
LNTALLERLGKEWAHADAEAVAEASDEAVTFAELAMSVGVISVVETCENESPVGVAAEITIALGELCDWMVEATAEPVEEGTEPFDTVTKPELSAEFLVTEVNVLDTASAADFVEGVA